MNVQGTRSEEKLAVDVLSTAKPPPLHKVGERSAKPEDAAPSASTPETEGKRSAETGAIERESVREAVEAINHEISLHRRSIRFEVDDRIDEVVVRIVDRDTSKVIRQIPPEEVIELRARIRELAGGLLDTKG